MSTTEGKKPETKMPVDKPEQKGELKLNHPKPFTGKREDLKKFLQDVKLYLHDSTLPAKILMRWISTLSPLSEEEKWWKRDYVSIARNRDTLVEIALTKKKGKAPQSPPSYTPPAPKKLATKELYTHICSLTAMLNEDEKEEFYQEAEKEGF